MSVELPFAPVDAIIRRNAGSLRVSADAAEALATRISPSMRPSRQPTTTAKR